jgi:hypothetical protein
MGRQDKHPEKRVGAAGEYIKERRHELRRSIERRRKRRVAQRPLIGARAPDHVAARPKQIAAAAQATMA